MQKGAPEAPFRHRHLLGIEGLSPDDINQFLDLADGYVELNRQAEKKRNLLRGRTIINCLFRELDAHPHLVRGRRQAARRRRDQHVGAGELDGQGRDPDRPAMTLNAMHPDVLVVRHPESGAVHLLSEKVDCAVVNAGDGSHEHPTQALLDALTIRRRKGRLGGLTVAICGDILHSRVARSNIEIGRASCRERV